MQYGVEALIHVTKLFTVNNAWTNVTAQTSVHKDCEKLNIRESNSVVTHCERLTPGCPNFFFFWQRVTIVIAGWFAGRTCKSHNKWSTQPPTSLRFYGKYAIYNCGRWLHNTPCRAAGWTPLIWPVICLQVKVKFTLEQAMKTQRRSRVIALLFL